MADIYGSHFEYGGISSRLYGLIIVNINTKRMSKLNGSIGSVTIFNKKNKKKYLIDDDYSSSSVIYDIEIVTENERLLEPSERKQIEKWLFNHREYRKLYIDVLDDYDRGTYEHIDGKLHRNYLNCRFINPERLEYNGGMVGYKVTIEADSNMFWQDPVSKTYFINKGSPEETSLLSVNITTDSNDYIYPKVTITLGENGGDIIITNNTDDSTRLTKFVDIAPHASIVMKGELNYISGQYYEKFEGRNFIRLLDGENTFTLLGDITSIEFEYSARRYM